MENNHEANNNSILSSPTEKNSTPSSLNRQQWIADELLKTYLAMDKPRPAVEVQALMVRDLSEELSDEQIVRGLSRLRKEREWVSVKAIIELSGKTEGDDGRPSTEIAWAMCPRTEEQSVVWTDEMAEAFEFCRKMLFEGDDIAARMVFKEQYPVAVIRARQRLIPVRWRPSLGWDQADRVRALSEAVTKGRIQATEVYGLLGPTQQDELRQQLPSPERKLLTGESKPIRGQLTVLQQVCSDLREQMPKIPEPPRPPAQTDEERSAHAKRVREQAARLTAQPGERA